MRANTNRMRRSLATSHRRGRCVVSSALAAVLISSGAAAERQPASSDVLKRLRRGHPRLMVLDQDIARVRELIDQDPRVAGLRDELRDSAERMLDEPPVEHRLVGPRLLGESRKCLTRVSTLAGMYRLEGDRRFADRAEKEMLAAAAFPDWNPKHFLDTAEMTNALAIGYDWLFDVLPESSRDAIRTAIVEKGLTPGLAVYRRGNWWVVTRANWNQVCNGGMVAGALAIADEQPAIAAEVIQHAARSIPLAMASFAPDGGCPEGPGYWNYAMRYTAYFVAAARTGLGTDFELTASPGFPETGLFRIHTIGPTGLAFNFADGGSRPTNAIQMMYFSRIFDRPVYAVHQRSCRSGSEILDLLWYDPRGTEADIEALPRDAFFRGVDVVCLRSTWQDPQALFVGFKGGDNAANHSNLDLGTFVLDALGERWAMELGADDYNLPGYFGDKRWTYYRLRTEGQNTLVLNEANQNAKARAPITIFHSTPQRAHAVADLSAAYRPHAERVRRGVAMLNRRQVLVQDELEAASPVEAVWAMHTPARVEASGSTATLRLGGKQLHIRLLEPAGAAWSVEEVRVKPPQQPVRDTRKLLVRIRTSPPLSRIRVLLMPGEGPADAPELQPLQEWIAGSN